MSAWDPGFKPKLINLTKQQRQLVQVERGAILAPRAMYTPRELGEGYRQEELVHKVTIVSSRPTTTTPSC